MEEKIYPLDTTSDMPDQMAGSSPPAPGYAPGKGFARTPDMLRYDGPQMDDYEDWDSWYFARQKWVFERMTGNGRGERPGPQDA